MKVLNKAALTIIPSLFLTTAVLAMAGGNDSSIEKPIYASDYTLVLLKDCKEISRQTMSEPQLSAYVALENASEKMDGIQAPIEAMQDQLDKFTSQIEQLTDKAIIEDEDSLHINKAFLKEQEEVVAKLEVLMTKHQGDFDAIEQQGDKIGELADEFEKALAPSIDGFDYDQIHIKTPTEGDSNYRCDNNSIITRL